MKMKSQSLSDLFISPNRITGLPNCVSLLLRSVEIVAELLDRPGFWDQLQQIRCQLRYLAVGPRQFIVFIGRDDSINNSNKSVGVQNHVHPLDYILQLERKRDWKMRVVKLQMYLADQVTDHLVSIQKHLVKIKEKAEDEQMMKALRRYQAEFEEALKYWNEGNTIDGIVVTKRYLEDEPTEQELAPPPSGRDLIETSGRSISVKQELTDSRPTWLIDDHVQWDERRATQVNNDRQSEIEYSPLTFELKNSPSPGGGSQMEMLPALRPFGLSLPPLNCKKSKGHTTEWDAHKNHISPLVMYILPPVFRLRGKCEENPTFYGHSELGYVNFTRLLTGDSHLREKFAKVGTLRVSRGHTEFVPDLKIFDSKTREAYVSGDRNRIRTLPLTTLRVLRMDVLPCALKNTNGWIDGHVNFRGTIANLVGKSPMRIFIENRMSAEEYQNRYKGRQWLEKRLADLYEEFLKEKAKIMDGGIEGRLLSERRDGESKECCPIFWDIVKYLQAVLEPTKNRTAEIDNGGFPSTMEQLKRLIFERILIERPEMEENSKRLESILCEWGGHSSCKADLLSIVDLIQRLTEIEALRPCWEDIKDSVINANSCPLCVLFKFMAGPGDSKMKGNMISQGDNILGKASYANREILNLEAIIEGYKNRESPPIDPALIPNEEIFHVLSTIEGCKKSKTFRFGYDKLSTRNFVMRSCGTVIFDLSRSDEEIPLAWCYLKQHMELLDRKDVRDRSDTDQMRHLILISNFLSWAKSPRSVKSKISEKTFHQRLPHPDYSEEYKLENMVYFIGQHSSKFRLYTTIIYSGIPFGEGEDVLAYIFKTAWDNELELPLFGNGKNVLPLIHINDLASVVSKTIGEREYPLMVFALNKNDKPILEQATKIAAALGSTKVVKFPSRNFQMKHCIPKIVDDLLKQDIRSVYNF
ncbi:unnamed protein product [Nesidiocoris tenuis]|uniref:Uncharacterized protein n=1 Tax=Nesidiocoris tenuis TaxID=355587 RepID=A0A6H5H1G9_9HEMI|nr:unnamed protein product [Nesidiocoris tenuis]